MGKEYSTMTPLHEIEAMLRQQFPDVVCVLADPLLPTGYWQLDVAREQSWVVAIWKQGGTIGIVRPDIHLYGQKPDEEFKETEQAAARIAEWLREPVSNAHDRLSSDSRNGAERSDSLAGETLPRQFDENVLRR